MPRTYKAGVLGATGAVGQRFISLLADHPWFELSALTASERSGGKAYADAARWTLDAPMPDAVRDVEVLAGADADEPDADVLFSAVPGGKAGKLERDLAARGYFVFSNARDNRMASDVPLVIPEVNPDHLDLVDRQGTDGFVVCNANCSAIILTLALAPLHEAFGVEAAHVTTLQALSGAGYPGVASLDAQDNVVPFIGGEEDKLESEPRKMLGRLADGADAVTEADLALSATCTRVPVSEGHLESVHATLSGDPSVDDVVDAVRSWRPAIADRDLPDLPSLPDRSLLHLPDEDRPQPRRDRYLGAGMTVTVGRIRPDPLGTVRFVCLGSNTIRGAAGQSVLNAELCAAEGRLG